MRFIGADHVRVGSVRMNTLSKFFIAKINGCVRIVQGNRLSQGGSVCTDQKRLCSARVNERHLLCQKRSGGTVIADRLATFSDADSQTWV